MADRGYSALTMLGFGALTFNSALAIYDSCGDGSSVAFVLAALVLLFLCLRYFEQQQAQRGGGGGAGRGRDSKIKAAAVWLTALLTAMFATRGAALMPLAVGFLVFLCLRDVDLQVRGGGGGINMHGQHYALAKVGFAVLTCNTALDTYSHSARRDPGLAALVFVSYTVLVILTALFVSAVARAHAAEQGQR